MGEEEPGPEGCGERGVLVYPPALCKGEGVGVN